MKNKKWLITVSGVVLLVIVAIVLIIASSRNYNKELNSENDKTLETTYVAYISMNPLVKLTFSKICQKNECTEPIIKSYELLNDDAKEAFTNVDLVDKPLNAGIKLLGTIAEDNNYEFEVVEIYTDWKEEQYFESGITEWEISVTTKTKEEINDVPEELVDAIKELGISQDFYTIGNLWATMHLHFNKDYTFYIDHIGVNNAAYEVQKDIGKYFVDEYISFKDGRFNVVEKGDDYIKLNLTFILDIGEISVKAAIFESKFNGSAITLLELDKSSLTKNNTEMILSDEITMGNTIIFPPVSGRFYLVNDNSESFIE